MDIDTSGKIITGLNHCVKILFNYRDQIYQTQRCSSRFVLVEPQLRASTSTGSNSVDKLYGRTTGRLRYVRPDSAYAIEGTAELALLYSN